MEWRLKMPASHWKPYSGAECPGKAQEQESEVRIGLQTGYTGCVLSFNSVIWSRINKQQIKAPRVTPLEGMSTYAPQGIRVISTILWFFFKEQSGEYENNSN